MAFRSISGPFFQTVAGHRYYPASLTLLFFLILVGYFIAWPIVIYDTDLWYHLSGGRYLWQNGTIARDAFFSYITPEKSWYNYYWLFQAVIYPLFESAGYQGLVLLRCLLYLLTALCIYFLVVRRNENRTGRLLGLSLSVCCIVLILNRELLVRPHLFSYLFIVLFLYILECKPGKVWLLPLLGVLWANLHGIEYPVMFLIVFAYLAEMSYGRLRGGWPRGASGAKAKWILISVFYTIFLTPGVIELVQTPFGVSFENAAHQNRYVAELLPFSFRELFVFAPVTLRGLMASLQNLLVLLASGLFLWGVWHKEIRISHAILFLGAWLLLARHLRFSYEFLLLCLPLLRDGLQRIAERDRLSQRLNALLLPIVLILFPILIFQNEMGNRPSYPFSESNLPAGVVRFLNRHAPGGRILNEPNTGGYLPWALNRKFKIYMDMQMTIFSDADFATAHNAFADENVFRAFVGKYDPSFISVSLNRRDFKRVVAADARFVPLFFDQAELLYVNRDHHRDLADRYGLKAIDPFGFRETPYNSLDAERLTRMAEEAARMAEEDPANFNANQILSGISAFRREYDRALFCAERIIVHYPESPQGYALRADALFGMARYDEAARLYEKAMAMGQTAKPENVYWNLHAAYVHLKEYRKAYRLLAKYVNPFVPAADYREIYQLGLSAASVGKIREAVLFLKIARMKTPAADAEYVQKIDQNLSALGGDGR